MILIKRLLFLISCLFIGALAIAQPNTSTSVTSGKSKVKKEVAPQSDWSGSASYGVSTNLQSSGEKRKFSHSFGFDLSYAITKKFGISAGSGISWKAEGQNIKKENENPSWDDISLGAGYGDKLTETISYSVGTSTGFPTSYESNLEQIKGTLGVSSGVSMKFFEKSLGWSNSVSAKKYFHTYDYSIVSGESNADHTLTFSTKLSYRFESGLSTKVGVSIWSTRLINGETTTGLSNSAGFSLGYTHKKLSLSAGYSFGNYDSDDGYQLMYFDDTKRIASLGVSFDF